MPDGSKKSTPPSTLPGLWQRRQRIARLLWPAKTDTEQQKAYTRAVLDSIP